MPSTLLITVQGVDRPGITSSFAHALPGFELVEMGQTVTHGWLTLSLTARLEAGLTFDQETEVLSRIRQVTADFGLRIETQWVRKNPVPETRWPFVITVMGTPIGSESVAALSGLLQKHAFNIDSIRTLSHGAGCLQTHCFEWGVSSSDWSWERLETDPTLKRELLNMAQSHGVDFGIQAHSLWRRMKRLVVFDMDSTLIENEIIDELAKEQNVYAEVVQITEAAMRGEMEFEASLRARVALLRGLSRTQFDRVFGRIRFTQGAAELVIWLKRLGLETVVVSGGFTEFAQFVQTELGLDESVANQLEWKDDCLTGEILGVCVTPQRKAETLRKFAEARSINLRQVVAVGDGANDLMMLEAAGLGVAFNAKPIVRERADLVLSQKNILALLLFMGISEQEVMLS